MLFDHADSEVSEEDINKMTCGLSKQLVKLRNLWEEPLTEHSR